MEKIKKYISITEISFFHSSIIKAFGLIVSLLLSQFIAKSFSVELFGFFNLFESYLQILVVLSLFGARQIIVKKVSILYNENKFNEIKSWFNSAIFSVSITSFIVILIYFISLNYLSNSPEVKKAFQIGGVIIYIKVLLVVLSSFYSAINKLWQSNLVDRGMLPFIFLTLLFGFSSFFKLNFNILFYLYLLAALTFLVLVYIYWLKFSDKIRFRLNSISLTKVYNLEAFRFLILSFLGIFFLKLDVIIVGFFGSQKDLGIYSLGAKLAFLLNFFTPVIHSVYTPKISILNNENNFQKIRKIFLNSFKILISLGFLLLIILFLSGKYILSFWGLEYIQAYKVLLLLSLANIISMSLSICLPIIMMCNQEKVYLKSLSILIIVTTPIMALISSRFEIESVALAMSIFITIEALIKFLIIKRNLFK